MPGYIYSAFDTRLDQLLVGCRAAILIRQGQLSLFWRAITSHVLFPLVTIGLLLVSIFVGNAYVDRYRDVFGFAIEPFLVAVLLVQLIVLSPSRLWAWTEWRLLKFLGRISYYVIELPFLRLQRMRSRLPQESPSPQLVAP